MNNDQGLVSDAEVTRLSELGDLYRFFRSHPNVPWGILRLKAIQGGYTEEETDMVYWAACIAAVVVAPEEEKLHQDAWRN